MPDFTIVEALDLALQHHQAGHLPEAEAGYREILARDPSCADAVHFLGVIAHQRGNYDAAVELMSQAVLLAPANAAIHSNLGEAYRLLGRLNEAVASFRRALALQPQFADAQINLGIALQAQGQADAAIEWLQKALQLQPEASNAHYNLGVCLAAVGRVADAILCYQRAIKIRPNFAEAHNNLGKLFGERGLFDDAHASFEQALKIRPESSETHHNLGLAYWRRGQPEAAIACYRRALALRPQYPTAHSDLVLALQYLPDPDSAAISRELKTWHQRHARPLSTLLARHHNDRSPNRRLRVGYVSADFNLHSVAFFLLPLLQAHDRDQFHVVAYSSTLRQDDVTARFQACTDEWCDLANVSDEAAARRIRDDRIDLLVDLSGHTAGNRLLIFARKPAPLQLSYLGYPGATGLDTIDGRLTDRWADPPGAADEGAEERLVRLPETAWCFAPLAESPPIDGPPAARCGQVTFGSFNNLAKATDELLLLWARILRQMPESRLLLKNVSLGSPSVVARLRAFFTAHGVAPDRLELIPHLPSPLDHLRCYGRVDLALDTFPYHGTTTTCQALWMGVPVITLAGDRHISRVGVSLLTNVGLPEFIAESPDAYVATAVAAAGDLSRLATLRTGLRERMQRSPLMDAPRFARAVEAAYREMWHRWCDQPASPNPSAG